MAALRNSNDENIDMRDDSYEIDLGDQYVSASDTSSDLADQTSTENSRLIETLSAVFSSSRERLSSNEYTVSAFSLARSPDDELTTESQTGVPTISEDALKIDARVFTKQGQHVSAELRDVQYSTLDGVKNVRLSFEERDAEAGQPFAWYSTRDDVAMATLTSIRDGIVVTDRDGYVQYLNPTAERILGISTLVAAGAYIAEVLNMVEEATRRRLPCPVQRSLSEEHVIEAEAKAIVIGKDGTEHAVEDSTAPIRDRQNRIVGAVLVLREVGSQRKLDSEIVFRATHDTLTGVLNRDEFLRRVQASLAGVDSDSQRSILLYVDLDRFKAVNDIGGHAAGDRLLKEVVTLVGNQIRRNDTIARLGGDEFGILIERCNLSTAENIAQKICDVVSGHRFRHELKEFHIGASIGLVELDARVVSASAALKFADAACYEAKSAGRNGYRVAGIVEETKPTAQLRSNTFRRIIHAIESNDLLLHWQRIVPISAPPMDKVEGELFVRMRDPDGQISSPKSFLLLGEPQRAAAFVDRWVLTHVFEWLAQNESLVGHVGSLSLNISSASILDKEFHRLLERLMVGFPEKARLLKFEMTENTAVSHANEVFAFCARVREYGAAVGLDRFGLGPISFNHLTMLPVDYVKFDEALTRGLVASDLNSPSAAAVRYLCALAKESGLQTVATCVESDTTRRSVESLDFDFAQGYAYHRPTGLESLLHASSLLAT